MLIAEDLKKTSKKRARTDCVKHYRVGKNLENQGAQINRGIRTERVYISVCLPPRHYLKRGSGPASFSVWQIDKAFNIIHVCIYIYIYICIYVHMCLYIYIYVYMYMCACIYVHVCIYVYKEFKQTIRLKLLHVYKAECIQNHAYITHIHTYHRGILKNWRVLENCKDCCNITPIVEVDMN